MEWQTWEKALLLRSEFSLRMIAAKTGRTYQACKDKRYSLKHPDRVRRRRRRIEARREARHFGKKAKLRGWTYLEDAALVASPWSVSSLVKFAEQQGRTYAGVKSRRGKLSGMGVRTLKELEGITVDGIPLKTHLDKEQKDEIQEAYNDELKQRAKSRGKVSRKDKRPVKEGVAKRVRRLKHQEIRKEYGLMQKRHTREEGGIAADCLWLIRYKSPMTANDAAVILEGSRSSISGIFSQLWAAVGGKYIKRERGVGLPYEYSPLEEFDPIFVYGLVRKYYAVKSRESRMKARAKKGGAAPEPPKQEQGELDLTTSPALKAIHDQITKLQDGTAQNNIAIGSLQEKMRHYGNQIGTNSGAIREMIEKQHSPPTTPINVGGEIKELKFAIGGMMEIRVIFTS